jgi:NADH-quinone oxidoreductase subunit M
VGALIALAGLIGLYLFSGAETFSIPDLTAYLQRNPMPLSAQHIVFPLLLFGFGILVSLWPFHTWAPIGYSAAPPATAMLHAGILKKFGLYGLLRIAFPLLPQAAQSWVHLLAVLCLGNILYAGWVAMRQNDLNLMLGNSSVAHVGFIFLGLASFNLIGVTGAVVVMVAHGLLAALAFGLSGAIAEQTRTLKFSELGGLLPRLPFLGGAFMVAALAGCGLPGLANFPGEIMVLFGSWPGFSAFTVVAAWGGLIISAIYMLRAVRYLLHGGPVPALAAVADASDLWRRLPYALLIAALVIFGCWPRLLTDKIKPGVSRVLKIAQG